MRFSVLFLSKRNFMMIKSEVIHSYFIIYIENIQCLVVEYGSHFTSEVFFFIYFHDCGTRGNFNKTWLMSDFYVNFIFPGVCFLRIRHPLLKILKTILRG